MTATTRGAISLEGEGTVTSRGFILRWDGGDPSPIFRLAEADAARVTAFSHSLPTGIVELARIQESAPLLGSLLGGVGFVGAERGTQLLELCAEVPIPALTDVPWEAAARSPGPLAATQAELFEQLLASLPVCRIVSGTSPSIDVDVSRPRLLLIISNPTGIGGVTIQVTQIRNACEQVLKEYPAFHVRVVASDPTWAVVAPIIAAFEPTVLVIVGHGWSNPQSGGPTLAFTREHDPFAVDRVSVTELADSVVRARSCHVVALIACDLVRASEKSGAIELIGKGVPEVVAMQGSIDQVIARRFLARFLGELLAGRTVPLAAAAARRGVREHAHAIFPSAFRSAGVPANTAPLADVSIHYARALAMLHARVAEDDALVEREALQRNIREILDRDGVALVSGAFGNGTSTLLRSSIASALGEQRNRPVLYLDFDKKLVHESLASWIVREFAAASRAHPILLPKSAPSFGSGGVSSEQELGAWVAESEISLVLDNLPQQPSCAEIELLKTLIACCNGPDRRGMLILAVRGALTSIGNISVTIHVPAFSPAEVAEYAKRFLPKSNADSLLQRTGGTPLLLDLERRMNLSARELVGSHSEETLIEYLMRLQEHLSHDSRTAAARLAQLDGPLDQALIEQFVTPDFPHVIRELSHTGLSMSFERDARTWLFIPQRKRAAFLTENAEGVQMRLAQLFVEQYDRAPLETMRRVTRFGGGGEYLRLIQQALPLIDRVDVSIQIPYDAQGMGLPAGDHFSLFEAAVDKLGEEATDQPDILISAARAALAVGQTERAEQWLQLLAALSPELECEALSLRVILAKDREQVEGIESMRVWRARILELVADPRAAVDEQWERIRREALFDLLPVSLFTLNESVESIVVAFASLLPQFQPEERAQFFATLAEAEMHKPAPLVRWDQVATWVTDAYAFLRDESNARVKTYALYQRGQYLRKRPRSQISEAWQAFEQSRAAGVQAREPRREGLALLRLAELESNHPELRNANAAWPDARLEELDAMLASLREAKNDALSLRVMGRLQQWAAHHESRPDRRRDRFIEAARALSARQLSSDADKRRFSQVCVQALEVELAPGGSFLAAQRFLGSLRFDIARRLGVAVPMDNPVQARDDIQTMIATT